jgi:hypothetical protein
MTVPFSATVDYIGISDKLTAMIRAHGRASLDARVGLLLVLEDNCVFFGIHADGKEFVSFEAIVGGKKIHVTQETLFNAKHWLELLEQKYSALEVTP